MGRQTPITLTILGKPLQVPTTPPAPATRRHACAQRRARAAFELIGPERDRFNRLHPRGFGGKFGRKLAELAGVDPQAQNTHYALAPDPDTGIDRHFDWEEEDPDRPGSEFTYFKIRGPGLYEDEETGEFETVESEAYLHMAPRDYDELAKVMSAAIMREKLKARPLDDDDPLSLYLHSILDLQDSSVLSFDRQDNPWYDEQHLEFTANPDGSWRILAEDPDGDQVDMTVTGDEFAALHAQLMRRVGTGEQPTGAKPITKASPLSVQ